MDIEGSCGADVPSAQRLVHTGATPLSMSPPRQLAPAGPVQDPASSPQCNEPSQPCHTATQGCPTPRDQLAEPSTTTLAASAEHSHHALEQTQRPVMPQLCVRLAGATIPALCHPPAVAASVPEAPAQRLPQPAQQQQQRRQQPLIAPVASAPAAAQWHSSPTVQPQTLQEGICGHVAPTHAQQMLPATALRQTIANSSDAKPAARMHAMADAVLPHSRGAPRGQAAEGAAQQGSRAGHSQRAAGSRSSRGGSYDRNLSGTRMSLRSRNPPADKTRRKVSNSSRNVGRVRSAFEVKAPAYATR